MGYRHDETYLLAQLTSDGKDHTITRIVTEFAKNWVSAEFDAAVVFAKANPATSALFFLDLSREFDEWSDAYEAWTTTHKLVAKPETPYVPKPWVIASTEPSLAAELLIKRQKSKFE